MSGDVDQPSAERSASQKRLPTVHEALQFTPLSSVVPFSPDVIPFPSAPSPCFPQPAGNSIQSLASTELLQSLNQDIYQPHGNSEKLLQMSQTVQNLLHPDGLTQFKFKIPAAICSNRHLWSHQKATNQNDTGQNRPAHLISAESGLGPFAEMVLRTSEVSYRYPTPTSPKSKGDSRTDAKLNGQPLENAKASTPIQLNNEKAFKANNSIPQIASVGLANVTPTKSTVVLLPNLSEPAKRAEYQAFPTVDHETIQERKSTPKKRKRDSDNEISGMPNDVDPREKSRAELEQLKNLIGGIFVADDNDGIDESSGESIFMQEETAGSQVRVLTPSAQQKLDFALRKVITSSRIFDIPTEHLVRIQNICAPSVGIAENTSLAIGQDWNENDVREWIHRVEVASHGLHAGKSIIRIMATALDDKQIYSEENTFTILKTLRNVLEYVVIPVTEARSGGANSEMFSFLIAEKKILTSLLLLANGLLKLIGMFLEKVDVAENLVTEIEYITTNLIFIDNAHTERDSVLGVQRFELARRTALDVLSKIFLRYPSQRTFIIDEILSSLEKLPVTPQSARQYRIADGKPIQLVSALVMRLVQAATSAAGLSAKKAGSKNVGTENVNNEICSDDDEGSSRDGIPLMTKYVNDPNNGDHVLERMDTLIKPLQGAAQQHAQYIMHYLVQRALNSTKSGDQPYRVLLDIFTEDFINCLGLLEWPSAELLLRVLLSSLLRLAENEKTPAPQKNMALDLLGTMGSGIIDLQTHLRQFSKSIDASESELADRLIRLADDVRDDDLGEEDMLGFDGPYRAIIEFLQNYDSTDMQCESARNHHIMQWASRISKAATVRQQESEEVQNSAGAGHLWHLCQKVEQIIETSDATAYQPLLPTSAEAKLSSTLITISSVFCRAQPRIFHVLISAMASDQATVKSKGLKSLVQLLEKDPSILNKGNSIINRILSRLSDISPMVRDSALSLVGKCLSLKPSLESVLCEKIIDRSQDPAIGVRKRVLRILKEIYLRNNDDNLRPAIAHVALQRIADDDNGVAELAGQTIEEAWIAPYYSLMTTGDINVKTSLALRSQVSLIIKTVQRNDTVLAPLENFLRAILGSKSKMRESNFQVCKLMVAELFDAVVDNESFPGKPSQRYILQTLSVFAKVKPDMFSRGQLELLQPYLKDLSSVEDLLIYRSAVVIFRHVLPHMSSLQHEFLAGIQGLLVNSLSRLTKMELNEVTLCLWTMDPILENTERLARVTISVLTGLHTETKTNQTIDNKSISKLQRYMSIAGYFGKNCNLDSQSATFKAKFPWWKGTSVSALIIDLLLPFTEISRPLLLRETAYECIGLVCHAWPQQFLRSDVASKLDYVFRNKDTNLERMILSTILEFFASEEKRSESGTEIPVGEGTSTGSVRLGSSLVANENDGISTSIAQTFLRHILRIALASADEIALIATKIIASVNRQGLVHPKECGPALVALETSPNASVASIAFDEHRNLHQKHETMFEKEYMKAIDQAFAYQQTVGEDVLGAKTQPFTSKLRSLFEVLKLGNGKVRKKFLANFCSRIDFDITKVDLAEEKLHRLFYSRFCLQNLAFFEYARIDEILHVVLRLEKVINDTGTSVTHCIENEILQSTSITGSDNATLKQEEDPEARNGQGRQNCPDAQINGLKLSYSPERLKHLTVASVILTMAWETKTFLSRQWNLQRYRESGSKIFIKDLNKAPSKVPGITGDKYWEKTTEIMESLASSNAMIQQCRAFVDLISVDHEYNRSGSDEDGDVELEISRITTEGDGGGYETPGDNERVDEQVSAPPSGGSKSKKRKNSMSLAGTPKKSRNKNAAMLKRGIRKKSTSSHSPDIG